MRVVRVVMLGAAMAWAVSCSSDENDSGSETGGDAGEGATTGGQGGNSEGGTTAGGKGGTGTSGQSGSAAGGSDAGSGGAGSGGQSPCECEGDPDVFDPEVHCTLPLELFCLDDDPFGCATTLSEALATLVEQCDRLGLGSGDRSNCADGTTELRWIEEGNSSLHRLVFDRNGRLIGRYYSGAAYHELFWNTCLGTELFDLMEYRAGTLPERTCEASCDLCSVTGTGGAPQVCGAGGQGGI